MNPVTLYGREKPIVTHDDYADDYANQQRILFAEPQSLTQTCLYALPETFRVVQYCHTCNCHHTGPCRGSNAGDELHPIMMGNQS